MDIRSTRPSGEPLLRVRGLRKRFGPTVALDDVSFELRAGQVHALVGENGAGKSTLMNVLAGALQPDAGTMAIDGRPYRPTSPLDARRAGVALIHQELSLCPHLTVAENVLMGRECARWGLLDAEATSGVAAELLAGFSHPELRPDRLVGELPLAARQVVEICRALAARAQILLMDEPTSSLQRDDVDRLFDLIRRLRSQGYGIVYISHFLEEVREIADEYTVLRDGRSVAHGPIASATTEQLVAHMVGRSVDHLFPARTRKAPGEVVLKVENLEAPPAVRYASFELRSGEVFGIAGLMGSGRTELVRAVFGLEPVARGAVIARRPGKPDTALLSKRADPKRRIQSGLGYLSEDRKGEGLALTLSIADNVTMTHMSSCSRRGWLRLRAQRSQALDWIRRLSIRARTPDQDVQTLSGGNQQKVALARLLHQNADVLLLDEPTRGIDIGSKATIYEAIARAADAGKAVLVVSSYLPELFGLCDRLAVMSRGRLSPARPIADWTPEAVLHAAIDVEAWAG
ncbi:MAG TPA: sugar ABC transporter ATP-binding protein [Vicinamibacterales bacterium]|nr:sugar ABC transporter ATP-binding protein [Vicinamibacterales bacterium]